jgi:hypothetical protein
MPRWRPHHGGFWIHSPISLDSSQPQVIHLFECQHALNCRIGVFAGMSNDSNAFAHFRSAVHKTVTNQRLRTLSLAAILTHAIGESM